MIFLNRTACVGGEVLHCKVGDKHNFNNQQKVRVDMFMDIVEGKMSKPDSKTIISLLSDASDTGGVYSQSEELRWFQVKDKPDYLIMDSYSELVDKKITHKDGWSFCGTFGNFKPEAFLDGTLIDGTLLNIELIKPAYDKFFEYIKNCWDIPIVFIHFPTTFDNRNLYINQGKAIMDAIKELSLKYNIQNVYADDGAIERKDGDCYHFGNKTIENMAAKIKL
jgi:hypothetical protein